MLGVSASASVLSKNIQDLFLLRLTGLISLHSKDSPESSPTPEFQSVNSSVLSELGIRILTLVLPSMEICIDIPFIVS